MENTQLEEKVLELASSIKKIGEISNDDYFYRTILFPGELVSALESEGEKDFSEDLLENWKNVTVAPTKHNQEQNYILRLASIAQRINNKFGFDAFLDCIQLLLVIYTRYAQTLVKTLKRSTTF